MKEKGIIRQGENCGMGGFLNPPTHPEHTCHVETDIRRRKEDRGGMQLSAAVTCEWLDDATRAAAKAVLNAWVKPSLESPEVQAWISQVLGYFKGCRIDPENERRQYLIGAMVVNPMTYADDHAGVRHIRKWYPEFKPTAAHFATAKWGA